MRTARMLAATAFAVTAAALSAAPVLAAEDPALEISPATATPGSTVTADTAACRADGTAEGDASAVGAGIFTMAPGSHDRELVGRFRIPSGAQPGTYEIVASCPDGGLAKGDLVVTLGGAAGAQHPRGHVQTGVGGALGPDPVKTAAGVAALSVAAAGGTWLLHRRVNGDGI